MYDKAKVLMNYYNASGALIEIGITKNVPEELKELSINASRATIKILDYINNHRNDTEGI